MSERHQPPYDLARISGLKIDGLDGMSEYSREVFK